MPQTFGELPLISHLGARCYPQATGQPFRADWQLDTTGGTHAPHRKGEEIEGTGQDRRG